MSRNLDEYSFSPKHFNLRLIRHVKAVEPAEHCLLHCCSPTVERALYTLHSDTHALFQSPFLYLDQAAHVGDMLSVPYERLYEFSPGFAVRPTFIFQPGRCGSTLLYQLLKSLNAPAVSEPPFFVQLGFLDRNWTKDHSDLIAALIRASVESLARILGPTPIIKLTASANAYAKEILRAFPDANIEFMARDMEPWVRSQYRAFKTTAQKLKTRLNNFLTAYSWLSEHAAVDNLIWYEELVQDPYLALERFGFSRASLSESDRLNIATVLNSDSQEGSSISRTSLAEKQVDESEAQGVLHEFLDNFDKRTFEKLTRASR